MTMIARSSFEVQWSEHQTSGCMGGHGSDLDFFLCSVILLIIKLNTIYLLFICA